MASKDPLEWMQQKSCIRSNRCDDTFYENKCWPCRSRQIIDRARYPQVAYAAKDCIDIGTPRYNDIRSVAAAQFWEMKARMKLTRIRNVLQDTQIVYCETFCLPDKEVEHRAHCHAITEVLADG